DRHHGRGGRTVAAARLPSVDVRRRIARAGLPSQPPEAEERRQRARPEEGPASDRAVERARDDVLEQAGFLVTRARPSAASYRRSADSARAAIAAAIASQSASLVQAGGSA